MADTRIDKDWLDAFVLELRLRDLTGAQIGDALAVVEEHLGDAGQGAQESFGDPVDYARSLAGEQAPPQTSTGLGAREVAGCVAGFAGIVLGGLAAGAGFAGEPVEVTVGGLVAAGVALLALGAVAVRPDPVLRWVATGSWGRSLLAALVPGAVFVALLLALPRVVLTAPWAVVTGLAAAGVLAGTVALWPGQGGDPIRDPRTGRTERPPALGVLAGMTFPLLGLLVVGLSWVMHLLS